MSYVTYSLSAIKHVKIDAFDNISDSLDSMKLILFFLQKFDFRICKNSRIWIADYQKHGLHYIIGWQPVVSSLWSWRQPVASNHILKIPCILTLKMGARSQKRTNIFGFFQWYIMWVWIKSVYSFVQDMFYFVGNFDIILNTSLIWKIGSISSNISSMFGFRKHHVFSKIFIFLVQFWPWKWGLCH